MRKKVYYKGEDDALYTPYECKVYNIDTTQLKKVYRSIDEIVSMRGSIKRDFPLEDAIYLYNGKFISTKQMRKRKVVKQMLAIGLL